jgi:hypothetical protein
MNMSGQQIADDDLFDLGFVCRFADDDLFDLGFVCRFFGGSLKPLHPSTVYRGIDDGRISRPFKTTKNTNRWTGRQLKADMRRMIEAERAPLRSPNPLAARRRAQMQAAGDALTETQSKF